VIFIIRKLQEKCENMIKLDFNLILYLFHEDYIQPEATSSSPHECPRREY